MTYVDKTVYLCGFCGEVCGSKVKLCKACKTADQRNAHKKEWEQENPDKVFRTAQQILMARVK